MLTLVTRLMACLGLVATLVWIAAPAVAAAWPMSQQTGESDSCPCCDGFASVAGGLGCAGCQAAPAEQASAPGPLLVVSFTWSGRARAAFRGFDPQPADPPPR